MAAPEFITAGGYYGSAADAHFHSVDRFFDQKLLQNNNNNHFAVDELFDFSKEDDVFLTGNSNDSSTITAIDSCNSPISGQDTLFHSFTDTHFSDDLCVPIDDLAELEWLSNFVEDSSFSTVDNMQNYHQLIPATFPDSAAVTAADTNRNYQPEFLSDVSVVPGKARSKRPRAAPCDWSSRLLVLSPSAAATGGNGEITRRKCLHCASEKTPQWRTGPMGPKTLCNACGVRYKSGRLVAEYRPSASPTFVATEHSNSHRKVLELRRQNEIQRQKKKKQRWQIVNDEDYLIRGRGVDHQFGRDYMP
ncbi:GATA transcription factor 2-like [Impatiens glandulifera]|uniref:GATA transcription factor 2-like n=1 Tax=Impatiens glandulifera TaxID=253017 RepID=UPI001FB15F34|nr:GATA transcription factor 2-like [Impatiens glandulifera]